MREVTYRELNSLVHREWPIMVYVNFSHMRSYHPDKILPIVFWISDWNWKLSTYPYNVPENKQFNYEFDYKYTYQWASEYVWKYYIEGNKLFTRTFIYILSNYIKWEK